MASRDPPVPPRALQLFALFFGALMHDYMHPGSTNAFEVKVALAYLRQCSVPATVTSSYSANQVTHRFAFPPNLVL